MDKVREFLKRTVQEGAEEAGISDLGNGSGQ
jgi:hypothetical protein